MKDFLFVGLGGGIGAILRYAISMVPYKGSFPISTLCINLIGAIFIGFVVGWFAQHAHANKEVLLFLKIGVCGGFTTFSSFSLEVYTLWTKNQFFVGGSYAILSVVLCILGVGLGQILARTLCC